MQTSKSIRLTESAIMLAFATVLSLIKIVDMPFGGSVTACSMLPILIIAYRYGTKWGLFTAFAASLLQMLMGLNSFSYVTSTRALIAVAVFDFLLAFMAMGLGGVFRKVISSQSGALAAGAVLACFIRYLCHTGVGATVWADISIPAHDALIYSIVYNASYMVPETIITVIGAIFVGQMLDFRRETIERVPATARKGSNLLGGLCLAAAVAFDALMLYNAVQTEEGFDITLIGGAHWLLMAAVSLCAVVLYFVPQAARPWTLGGFALAYDVVHVIQHGTAGADWAMLAGLTAGAVVLALAFAGLRKSAVVAAVVFFDGIHIVSTALTEGLPAFVWPDAVWYIGPVMAVALGALAILALNKYDKTRAQRLAAKPEEEKTPVHAG